MTTMTPTQRKAMAVAMAAAIAIPAEGLYQVAYYDPPGVLSVCYGHTGADVVKNRLYSLAECAQFLSVDMREAVNTTDRCLPGLPIEALAAIGDAVYNLGPRIACDPKNSTLARKWLVGDLPGVCAQLPRWDKARVLGVMVTLPGLTTRRGAEMALCMKGVPYHTPSVPAKPVPRCAKAPGDIFAQHYFNFLRGA